MAALAAPVAPVGATADLAAVTAVDLVAPAPARRVDLVAGTHRMRRVLVDPTRKRRADTRTQGLG